MDTKPRVAQLGLGAMGSRIARRIREHGWPLAVYDVYAPSVKKALEDGSRGANSPRDAADGADFVVCVVRTYAQAVEAFTGADGLLAGLQPGAAVILLSTVAPEQARVLAELCEAGGVELLDCPMSGGTPGAEAGTLSLMAGGPTARFERCRPLLEAFGSRIHHVGQQPGDGQSAKMVNQLLCSVQLAAAAEALVLARKAGLDQVTMLEIVSHSSAASWMLQHRAPRMVGRNFDEIHSALSVITKDIHIVNDGAAALNAATPLAAAAREVYKSGIAMGFGDLDDSVLIQVYERLSGQ